MSMNAKAAVAMVPVADIAPADFNPKQRTTERALTGLLDDIRRNGILSPLHIIDGGDSYTIVDGHRRHACATALKMIKVPCIIHDDKPRDAARLWAVLNKSTKTINSLQWMQYWYDTEGVAEKDIPPGVLGTIRSCLRIFGGRAGIKYLLDHNTAPSVAKHTTALQSRLESVGSLEPIPIRTVGLWLVDKKMQAIVQSLMGGGRPIPFKILRKIHHRIRIGAPFTLDDMVSGKSKAQPD